ncbi:MAG: GNAT family N-acetyltransferase [Coriobacteriales bacterium]|nr:GNAT family N-acetyltransferase [Coriobacteriales bacterium]
MIRKATASDIDAVARIYDEIHQMEENGEAVIGWSRGVYPTKAIAEDALRRDDLFVIEKDGEVLGSSVINKIQVEDYARAKWEHEADADQVCVLHTLTISPHAGKMGLGRQFVDFYEAYALENGCFELRIDTNERNLVARRMYAKLGYKEIAVVPTVFNGIPDVNMVLLEKYLDQDHEQ